MIGMMCRQRAVMCRQRSEKVAGKFRIERRLLEMLIQLRIQPSGYFRSIGLLRLTPDPHRAARFTFFNRLRRHRRHHRRHHRRCRSPKFLGDPREALEILPQLPTESWDHWNSADYGLGKDPLEILFGQCGIQSNYNDDHITGTNKWLASLPTPQSGFSYDPIQDDAFSKAIREGVILVITVLELHRGPDAAQLSLQPVRGRATRTSPSE